MHKFIPAFLAALSCFCVSVHADETEVAAEVAVSTEETTQEEGSSSPQLRNYQSTEDTTSTGGCGCGKTKK